MRRKPQLSRGVADSDLAEAAWRGDPRSLGLLFDRYRPRLYAAALALLGYGPGAEDAVHDTFLTAIGRMHELRDPGAVGGWLHAILRRRCLMELRHRRAFPTVDMTEIDLTGPRTESLLEERIHARELREWVWDALAELPEALRLTVMLRYFGSYESYDELASILAVPVGTVRSRLHQAKLHLAERMLECAASADGAQARKLNEERLRVFSEMFRDLYRGGRDRFLERYADDLEVRWTSTGRVDHGREQWAAEIDSDLRDGVRLHPRRALAADRATVVEAVFENPPEDPYHCPPGVALVMFGTDERVERVHVHFCPRPPRDPD